MVANDSFVLHGPGVEEVKVIDFCSAFQWVRGRGVIMIEFLACRLYKFN